MNAEHVFSLFQSVLDTGTSEQKALAAAALLDAERFSGIGDINGNESNSNLLQEKAKGSSVSTNIGEKVDTVLVKITCNISTIYFQRLLIE